MTVLYNDIDDYVCDWTERLIERGLVANGRVVRGSITELSAHLDGSVHQLHLFSGIALWSAALRLAGVSDQAKIWTGSCPCQPFSVAGKQKGTEDERHLWPVMGDLISQHLPPMVVGEQVASPDGREWLARVFSDLEGMGYAVAGADTCSAGVSAPHQRQRLYWGAARLGHADLPRLEGRWVRGSGRADQRLARSGGRPLHTDWLSNADRERQPQWEECDSGALSGERPPQFRHDTLRLGTHGGAWGDEWVPCVDRKVRRVKPEVQLVVDARGTKQRVGRLRAYGNAINPIQAARFIEGFIEAVEECSSRAR
jgi:DNA (cytosine-5)-methyltransferase 1